MAHSISEGITVTQALLRAVQPHSEGVLALMALEDFLPIAVVSLDTIGTFKAEEQSILQTYIKTCKALTETIQETEASGKEINWRTVTVDGESWHYHREKLQTCIQLLQANAALKKATTPLPPYEQQQPPSEPQLPPYGE